MGNHKIFFVYNPNSGTKISLEDFSLILQKKYPHQEYKILKIEEGIDLKQELAEAFKEYEHIVACGGDGTVREVVQHIVDREKNVLSVIPLGTFNHFAKDLEIPMDIEQALTCLESDREIKVDVGEANGIYFVNNSSVGCYVDMAKKKDALRKQVGRFLAFIISISHAFMRFRSISIEATVKGKKIRRKTPFVFIGNNRYNLKQGKNGDIGTRNTLNEHHLHFFATKNISRFTALKLFFHFLKGDLTDQKEYDEILTPELILHSRSKKTYISADGEIYQTKFPLHYSIKPNSLRIRLPLKNA